MLTKSPVASPQAAVLVFYRYYVVALCCMCFHHVRSGLNSRSHSSTFNPQSIFVA
jgi:hypothetical protein